MIFAIKFRRLVVALGLWAGAHAAELPRVAVLDFVRTDSPGSLDAAATDFSRAVQARLLANNQYAWVERQELDRITRETDLNGLSRGDAVAAVRLGHLLKADLLLRGQIAPQPGGRGELTLEVIDLKRAELLAIRTVPQEMSASLRLQLGGAAVSAASEAAAAALEEARGRLTQLESQRVIAPLYFKNIGRTDRAGFIEAKLRDALTAAATPVTGTRVLRFPRAGAAGEESSLVLAGLTDTDPDAWQHVADAYVWGTILEDGADGVEFPEAPVTISLQVVDSAGEAREVRWEGPVKTLESGLQKISTEVLTAAKAGSKTSNAATGRKQIAESLRVRAGEVWQTVQKERNQPRPGTASAIDFLRTTPGRQLFAYRLGLLEAACFFDPLNRDLQKTRLEAAWASNPADPLVTLQGHWLRLADYEVQARRFERKPDGSPDVSWLKLRTIHLVELVKALESAPWNAQARGPASPEDIQRQRQAAFVRWGETVVTANRTVGTDGAALASDADNRGWMEELIYLNENSGDYLTARRLTGKVWPVLSKSAGSFLKGTKSEMSRQNFINQLYSIYDAFGEYDLMSAMLDEAWKAGLAPLPAEAVKPPPRPRTDRAWKPARQNQFFPPQGAAGPELPKLDARVREIELWPTMNFYQFDRMGGGLQKRGSGLIDAMAWQKGRLWIAESGLALPPGEGPPNPQGPAYLWRYDPALHEAEYVTAGIAPHSQIRGLQPVGEELWLALDADGVWRQRGSDVTRFKAEEGLMSPRMAAVQLGGKELFFLGGSAPAYSISRYDLTTGKWAGVQLPVRTGPALPSPAPGMPPGVGTPSPQLAVSGNWLCVGAPAVSFYELTENRWVDLPLPPLTGPSLPGQMGEVFSLVSADDQGFWLGAYGRLLFVDPQLPTEPRQLTLPGLPMAATHHGPWLWLAMNDSFGHPKLVLIDKRTTAIVGVTPLPQGMMRKIVATDTRVWVGGSTLVEVILAEPRAAKNTEKEALTDHPLLRAVWHGDLARVKAVLATKPNMNEATTSGWTALMIAVEAGRTDLAEELLKAGASPNHLARNGRTALHLAAEADSPALIELLFRHGSDAGLRPPVRIMGLSKVRPLAEDRTLPPENKIIPAPPTGLKATVNSGGAVVLTWQEHAGVDARYHVTKNNVVIADLPAGVKRFVDANPPWGEAKVRYGVSARNVWGHWEARENEVLEVTVDLPASVPTDVVQLPAGFGMGSAPVALPRWAASRPVLIEAVVTGRNEAVRVLLNRRTDLNITDGTGQTALMAAIRVGAYETARLLLAAGAKAEPQSLAAESAASLMYQRHDDETFFREVMAALSAADRAQEATSLILEAAGNGQINDLELLRSLGGELGGLTAAGESALSLAIQRDQVETALWLLEQKVPLHRKIRGPLGPIHTDKPVLEAAIRSNRPEIIARLLAAGCEVNQSLEGKPLVVWAAQLKSFAVLRLLQERGADMRAKDSQGKTLANHLSPSEIRLFLPEENNTASWPLPRGKSFRPMPWTQPVAAADPARKLLTEQLVAACKAGNLAGAKSAVLAGAEINQLSEDGRAPLHHALIVQAGEVARWLVTEGASVNLTSRGGNTPLNFAIQNGQQPEMIEMLLQAGADPNAFGTEGYPPVFSAVVSGNHTALKRLLQTEADVNQLGYNSNQVLASPLAMALARGDEEAVALLLAAGASPRARTWSFATVQGENMLQKDSGPTLLMYAAAGKKVSLVKQMIALGHDPKFRATGGHDALSWAAGAGGKEAVEFLLPLSGLQGQALQNARRNNHGEIVQILQKAGYQ